MSSEPLLVRLHRSLIIGDHNALDALADDPDWPQIRMIISTPEEGGVPVDLDISLNASDLVIPALKGPFLFFISADVVSRMRNGEGGKLPIPLDHSISFDSNFAEDLRAVFEGRKQGSADYERVLKVLQLKAENPKVQFDLLPFLHENVRLVRDSPLNHRPLRTIVAFRMIDYLDWAALRQPTPSIKFTEPKEMLLDRLAAEADAYLKSLFLDDGFLAHEKQVIGIEALLLRLTRLWHQAGKKRDPHAIFEQLIDFCIFDLQALPQTELSIIWKGLMPQIADFFAPIVKDNIKERPRRITGMAWDLGHLRLLERSMRCHHVGHFFVAHFVSNDMSWRSLLKLNPIDRVVIDDASKGALVAREHELEFQKFLNRCMSERARAEMTPARIEARRRDAQAASLAQMDRILSSERETLSKALPLLR